MTTGKFTLTIHMVSSLDGFIAKKDNSIDWFDAASDYAKGNELPDAEAFLKTIDCYVMGARTYELALELSKEYGWAYGDKPTIVLTHRNLPAVHGNIEFYAGGLEKLVNERLQSRFNNAWVVGGAMLVKDLLRQKLVDEIRISVLPILLGNGLPFFDHIGMQQALDLKDVTAYKNGMVEMWYEVRR